MLRTSACLIAVVVASGALFTASAQTAAPAPSAAAAHTTAKPSRVKLTVERLKELKAKWNLNKGKLKICRKEVRRKGLAGDDRWFFIEDCMDKT